MDELLTKLKTKYPDLTLSTLHLGRIVRDRNKKYVKNHQQGKENLKNL